MAILIRGGTAVTADAEQRADILIEGETIAAIGPNLDAPAGAEIIDAGGSYVMPGGSIPTHIWTPFGNRGFRRLRAHPPQPLGAPASSILSSQPHKSVFSTPVTSGWAGTGVSHRLQLSCGCDLVG